MAVNVSNCVFWFEVEREGEWCDRSWIWGCLRGGKDVGYVYGRIAALLHRET